MLRQANEPSSGWISVIAVESWLGISSPPPMTTRSSIEP